MKFSGDQFYNKLCTDSVNESSVMHELAMKTVNLGGLYLARKMIFVALRPLKEIILRKTSLHFTGNWRKSK